MDRLCPKSALPAESDAGDGPDGRPAPELWSHYLVEPTTHQRQPRRATPTHLRNGVRAHRRAARRTRRRRGHRARRGQRPRADRRAHRQDVPHRRFVRAGGGRRHRHAVRGRRAAPESRRGQGTPPRRGVLHVRADLAGFGRRRQLLPCAAPRRHLVGVVRRRAALPGRRRGQRHQRHRARLRRADHRRAGVHPRPQRVRPGFRRDRRRHRGFVPAQR